MSGPEADSPNPFIRYRWLLDSYRAAIGRGWTDADFVSLVQRLNDAVAQVSKGRGFEMTPLTRHPSLAAATSLPTDLLWVKDDTINVGGSHKARHLFGVLLDQAVAGETEGELAIASCGNAAVAAAVVAKAVGRKLRVFIPTWADPTVLAVLERLDSTIEVAPRRPGEVGDPTVLRMREAIDEGSVPFSVQGTITPATLDGGRTIGWELAEQLGIAGAQGTVHVFVQVGGGALAASLWRGLNEGIREQWLAARPILHTVQTDAAAPLNRAWRSLLVEMEGHPMLEHADQVDRALEVAQAEPHRFMWAWEEVGTSAASGILDDFTYDWVPVVEGTLRSEGRAEVVSEGMILRAHELARTYTAIKVDPTGSAGLAGLFDPAIAGYVHPQDNVVVLFTGIDRNAG
ncbi:MAG: PLP-dependent lyase/thiolase [Acidimicrobiia bacterium]